MIGWIIMEDNDHGHRYGNFPNYYSFHPPQNRLDVLARTGILDYIISRLVKPIQSCGPTYTSTDGGDDAATASIPVAVGDCDRSQYSGKKPRLHKDSLMQQSVLAYYCDLRCNEGDLTMAMSELLSSGVAGTSKKKIHISPVSSQECKNCTIECLGLDIDPMLIERAYTKYPVSIDSLWDNKADGEDQNTLNAWRGSVLPSFKVANLCSAAEHNRAVSLFLDERTASSHATNTKDAEMGPNPSQEQQDIIPCPVFQLTTIFSTTMWIHVHAGDEGLKAFLERACGWTKNFLLVEPQPSGW
ncbi:hypothetical protein HJC23_013771 [Cyclotella cryptica]|uniref:RNA methyltransferase n=1 Tax=Cyclotella cryptica TaxID=29204 RepID=A0ABD3PFE7_9STRA